MFMPQMLLLVYSSTLGVLRLYDIIFRLCFWHLFAATPRPLRIYGNFTPLTDLIALLRRCDPYFRGRFASSIEFHFSFHHKPGTGVSDRV